MKSEPRSQEEIQRMGEIWDQLPEDLAGLTYKLSDPDYMVRRQAARKMAGLEDADAVEPLLQTLEDEHHDVRAAAALALGMLNQPQAVPALLNHLANDPKPWARLWAAIGADMIDTEPVAPAMEAALSDPEEKIRTFACWHFVHKNDARALHVIRPMLQDPEPLQRWSGATMLIRLGLVGQSVMDLLTDDPSWDVRQDVAQELIRARIGDERIVQTVERLMREPEAEKYEAGVDQYEEAMSSVDFEEDEEEELFEREKQEIEDMRPKRLAELLRLARQLLED